MKEELEKEADKYAKEITKKYVFMEHGRASALGYLAGAESREKRIVELENENEQLKEQIKKMQFDAVKAAYERGETIQYNLYGDWVDWSEPTFDDEPCNYRIKEK